METVFEVNFDGLVGPTHNYAGLSPDNLASRCNMGQESSPKRAALEGLKKMKLLSDLGVRQAILPPHPRPKIELLKQLGFYGTDEAILKKAYQEAPNLLNACYSSAYMWAANGATVTPSWDNLDNKLHITPANLHAELHRSIESENTEHLFKYLFNNKNLFNVHSALPRSDSIGDEGAANHMRLCPKHQNKGLHIFVYGRHGLDKSKPKPKQFHARQTLEASQAIARSHQLDSNYIIFIQSNPDAIDAGAFHNDVIAVSNENVLLYHEQSFLNQDKVIYELKKHYERLYNSELICIEISKSLVSLEVAVKTYLFNSQIVTLQNNKMAIIAPLDCQEDTNIQEALEGIIKGANPIDTVHYVDVNQSMRNGGGPACLRLRVLLTEKEVAAIPETIFLNSTNYNILTNWVETHYRDKLKPEDLQNIELMRESEAALQSLSKLLKIDQ